MVTAARVSAATETLLDPEAGEWARLRTERVELQATPLVLQPSEYVQTKWKDLLHGQTREVRVSAAHNQDALFFRLEWDDDTDDSKMTDTANFPDQAGVMLPLKEDAPISEMGLADQPVNMWLWRADLERPNYVTATGRGTARRHPDTPLSARATWRDGTWRVVIARPFKVDLQGGLVVPLAPGMTHKCTFAIWQGANKERGGLKAYQPLWQTLEIEA